VYRRCVCCCTYCQYPARYLPEADKDEEGDDEENDGDGVSGQEYVNDAFVFLKRNAQRACNILEKVITQ